MKVIWPVLIIFAIVYSMLTGRIELVADAILKLPEEALAFVFALIASSCFWTGMMFIMQDVGIIEWLTKALRPIMKLLFPRLNDEEAIGYISANIAANMFGLGFAATPSGLKGIKRMQEVSNLPKDVASDEMITFLILNTSGVTLIPTTVIAIRSSLGAKNPTDFLFLAIIATLITSVIGLLIEKALRKEYKL